MRTAKQALQQRIKRYDQLRRIAMQIHITKGSYDHDQYFTKGVEYRKLRDELQYVLSLLK